MTCISDGENDFKLKETETTKIVQQNRGKDNDLLMTIKRSKPCFLNDDQNC